MSKPKKPLAEGYAIFRAGFWLVCPSHFLAVANQVNDEKIIKVELTEVPRRARK